MEVERNLLRKVIERLDKEYESLGWQIEYIDLRWGISPDAGEDNRTMTICLNELAQCQKLSPRPNFIMLIGERYGWRPLPEVVSVADMQRVYEAAMPEEIELLDRWYVRDDNDLIMQGVYKLKSRLGSGYDGDRFHREVELPLLTLFYRELPFTDCSATEMEIRKGAFDADHAADHAFAYMRSLKDVPDDKHSAYYDSDASGLEYIARLKRKVAGLTKPENVYEENVAWSEYLSAGFASRFSQTIEEHLRKIVEKEVSHESVDDIDYELFEHREYAASEAVGFYGRADDIKKIREYIDSTEPDMPLWIKGDSGLGKSALMAKVVSLYTADKSYCVMPFFSSLTPRSSGARSMLELVRSCFDREYVDRYRKDKRKPYEKFVNLVDEAHRFSPDKRYLIIIDAFNQLDTAGYDDFDSLVWATDKEKLLPFNVKIIITSTNEGRFPKEHPRLHVMHLEAIKSDALWVVVSRLQAAGRRLQPFQLAQLKVLLGDKEQSALYLSLLSSVLQHYDSTMDLTGLPGDYVSMCSMILDRLASPQMHGRRLTRLALAMIVTSSDGVDVNSLNGLLASDYELQAELMERSFHLWIQEDVRSVPPIIWSRLFYDLDRVILVSRSTSIGVAVKVRHDAIYELIKYRWLTDDERRHASELQVRWYEENLLKENKLAIRDLVHAVHAPIDHIHSWDYTLDSVLDGEKEMSIRKAVGRKLWGILSDERYVLLKEKYFPDTIVGEYDRLLSIYTELGDIRRRELVSQMKNFVSYTILDDKAFRVSWSVGQNMPPLSPLELQARMINLWDGHPLREIPPERLDPKLMRDRLNNIDSERYTLFSIDNCGRYPWLNPSGEKLYRIVTGADGHPILERLDLVSGTIETIFIFIEPFTYAVSADEKILAVHYSEGIRVYKLAGTIQILNIFNKGITWMSLSENGQYIAYGGPTIKTYRVEIATSRSHTWRSADEGLLSPSGNRLWIYYIKEVPEREKEKWDCIVGCCDFASLKSDTVFFKYDKKPSLITYRSVQFISTYNVILGCSEDIAVIGARSNIYKFSDDGLIHWGHHRQAMIISVKFIPETSDFYLFYGCSGAYKIMRINGTILSTVEQGNMHEVDQVTPDFSRALSIDDKKVFDFRQLRKSFAINNHGNYAGINSFSASYSGDIMSISTGRNISWEAGEIRVPILTVKNLDGGYDEMFLDIDRSEYCNYVSASAVSPDGKYLAYCTYSKQSYLCVYDIEISYMIARHPICAQASSILFTGDSRWIVVITSDWLVKVDTSLYLFDCNGNLIKELLLGEGCSLDEDKAAIVSPDNKYVSVGISGPLVDLSACEVVNHGKKVESKFSLKAIRKYEDRIYDNYDLRGLFHPVKSTVVDRYLENGELCIDISASGRYMFTIDTDATMSVVDRTTGKTIFCLKNVESVLPVADDRHFYVSFYDNTISLYDVDGNRLQFTSLHNAKAKRYWQSTAQGLAVAKHDCHCALFATDPAHKVNELPVTVLRRRWDLTTGKLRDPEAVCPMCGHVIDKGFSVDEMHCPGCGHRLRLIVNTDKNYPAKILNGILKVPALARKIIK